MSFFSDDIFTRPIGCLEGTDFCPSPRDSSLDCVSKMVATNRVITGWERGLNMSQGQYKH